jgi:hypothetical protein
MFSLIVEPTETRLNGITLYEQIDIDMLNAFKTSDFATYECKWGSLSYNEKPTLNDYAANYKKKLGLVAVDYTRGKKKFGRVNPVKSLGMTAIRRITRNTFMRNTYYDLDMDNCHPVLLRGIIANSLPEGKKIELEYPYLSEYCDKRRELIEKVMRGYNCDRKRAKNAFISLMYNGSVANWKRGDGDELNGTDPVIESWLDKFHDEIQKVTDLFITKNPEQYKLHADAYRKDQKNAGKKNERGSFLSTIAQDFEIKIIDHLLSYIMFQTKMSSVDGHNDKHIISYSYDGFMLLKERVDANGGLSALLEDLAQRTFDFCGVEINFSAKDMNDEYHTEFVYTPTVAVAEVRETDKEREKREKAEKKLEDERRKAENRKNSEERYNEMKREFEKTNFKIHDRGEYIKLVKDGNRDIVIIRTRKQLCDAELHMSYGKDLLGNELSFIDKWIHDPKMKMYETMDTFPNVADCPKNCFNMWTPYAMENVKSWSHNQQAIDFFVNHMFVLSGEDKTTADYFMKYLAHIIQYPHLKSICPTMISAQGAGKSSIVELMKVLLGDSKVLTTTQPERNVWGQFNNLMMGVKFVNLDECDFRNAFGADGTIKGLIKATEISINNKGVSEFVSKSSHVFFATTNSQHGCFKTTKDDRRNFVIRSSNKLKNDKAYFDKFYAYLKNTDAMRSFYEYLKTLPDVEPVMNDPPKTEYQNDIVELSKTPLDVYLETKTQQKYNERCELLEMMRTNKELAANTKISGDYIETFTGDELLKDYSDFCAKSGFKYETNVIKLGVSISLMVKAEPKLEGCLPVKKTNKGNMRQFNYTKLAHYYGFVAGVKYEYSADDAKWMKYEQNGDLWTLAE